MVNIILAVIGVRRASEDHALDKAIEDLNRQAKEVTTLIDQKRDIGGTIYDITHKGDK